jgi:signal peptidase I
MTFTWTAGRWPSPTCRTTTRSDRRYRTQAASTPTGVPPGDFYVLGDNRAISCDSRYWGTITGSSIVGKVVLVWWHDDHPEFRAF